MAHLKNKTGSTTQFTCDIIEGETFIGKLTVFNREKQQVIRAGLDNGPTMERTSAIGRSISMDEITEWVRTITKDFTPWLSTSGTEVIKHAK